MHRSLVFVFLMLILTAGGNAQSFDYEMDELEFEAASGRPLEVVLDIDAGEVIVEKGDESHSGEVAVEFQVEKFKSKLGYNEKRNRLHVELDGKNWHKSGEDNRGPIVRVFLPYGVDIRMKAKIKAGEINMELGGLRLEEFDFSTWAGEVNLNFEERNPIIMSFMDIDLHVGEGNLTRLGNARFEKADINHGIGEIDVDFSGDLLHKSMANVDLDIGEAQIQLPGGVGVRMQIGGIFSWMSSKDIDSEFSKRGRYYYTDGYENAAVQFSLRVTPGLGELTVGRD